MTPAPLGLTRERIVGAALELLDADGVDSFSMRRLGSALGADPMAVYHHLPTKAALFDAVADALWSQTVPEEAGPEASWPEIVAGLARGLRRELLAHPRLVPLVATRPGTTPAMLALIDGTLGRLSAAGLAPAEAMRLLDCVVGYTVGKVQGELREPVRSTHAPDDVSAGIGPETFPHLAAAFGGGYTWAPDEEFERGLGAMLAGWQIPQAPPHAASAS